LRLNYSANSLIFKRCGHGKVPHHADDVCSFSNRASALSPVRRAHGVDWYQSARPRFPNLRMCEVRADETVADDPMRSGEGRLAARRVEAAVIAVLCTFRPAKTCAMITSHGFQIAEVGADPILGPTGCRERPR
jgi:hypothetical protein